MHWIFEVYQSNPTAQAIAILALVCVVGMSLGSLKFSGVKLGTSGVLFAGIFIGYISQPIDVHTLEFVREFGLILFVFCMGLQLGPGFFASLRQSGLLLNLLALLIVGTGALLSAGMGWLLNLDGAAVLGVFSGASTNTPSLGAAQQTLSMFPGTSPERSALPALACAVTYPCGILGAMVALLVIKRRGHIDVLKESQDQAAAESNQILPLERRTLELTNPGLDGVAVSDLPGVRAWNIVISRIRPRGQQETITARRQTQLHLGDLLLAIGTAENLLQFELLIGHASDEHLPSAGASSTERKIVLTNSNAVAQTVEALQLDARFGVVATSITRGDIEIGATPSLKLRFGDVLQVVGNVDDIERAADHLGNSVQALNETHFVPLFAGIGLGILVGTFPIHIPGLAQPLRLGLAGGPLIIAILVGRIGRVGNLVWHMPRNANMAFRELGISLFFAGVGLLAGPTFFAAAFSLTGCMWLLAGLVVTMLPLLLGAYVARRYFAMNYVTLCGLLAGSMTSPPVLTFASGQFDSKAPAVAYASVYPLTMLFRIIAAQALAVVLCS